MSANFSRTNFSWELSLDKLISDPRNDCSLVRSVFILLIKLATSSMHRVYLDLTAELG